MQQARNGLSISLSLALAALVAVGTSCNSHPVQYAEATGAVEHVQTVAGGVKAKVDLLWVIDNSGSMCQEQLALREAFPNFINKLTEEPVDFHIAVTTTHNIYSTEKPPRRPSYDRHLFGPDQEANEDDRNEPIAEAGQIQSTPHPALGFNDGCHFEADSSKDDGFDRSSIQPVKDQLTQAIKCTQKPGQYENFSNSNNFAALTRCAVADDCSGVSKSDDYGVDDLVADIFPCGQKLDKKCESESDFDQVYRNIPRILRTEDYSTNGNLQVKKLRSDFACMSFVGTRGTTYEQGLRNAALAVHPLMTGGPKGEPFEGKSFEHPKTGEKVEVSDGTNRPNHGFLRKDAATTVLFVTDENDCSHNGHVIQKRALDNSCGEVNCYFPTAEGSNNKDDLIGFEKLYNSFIDNLKKSRRKKELTQSDLIVGSIHGNPAAYKSSQHPVYKSQRLPKSGQKCGQDGFPAQTTILDDQLPVCSGSLGTANSGDRYANFTNLANSNDYSTFPSSPLDKGSGAICTSEDAEDALKEPVETIAELVGGQISGCLNHRVLPCNDGSECPAFHDEYDKGHGKACQTWGETDSGFCASAIRVRMRPTEGRSIDELSQSNKSLFNEYCVESSIGEPYDNGCIVKRSKYNWEACTGNKRSIELLWTDLGNNQDPKTVFSDFDIEARYTENKQKNVDRTGGGGSGDAASKAD